tara:strand:- start:3967 stop:5022 length:1056 start_codon:yes stop_codon:yes gene_type:complete
MLKILVTGGAGFIGSHTCLMLLEKGYQVLVIDSFINSSERSLEQVKNFCTRINNFDQNKLQVYKGDLRNFKILETLFKNAQNQGSPIECVIHFAGLKAVKESVYNPTKYWDFNVISAINLIQVMEQYNCYSLVFSSSATLYGDTSKELIDENTNINPRNCYGSTKYVIEMLLNDIYKSQRNKWKIANLRYFNPIGAHYTGLIGEDPNGTPNNIFPLLLQVAHGEKAYLEIYGNDWPTNDGTGIRDYVHVMDIAEGHIKTLEYLIKNDPNIINLNLGTGIGTSVLQLIKAFEEMNKVKIPYIFSERRNGDVARLVADNQLAKKYLRWSPSRDINEMCRDGWNWKKNNPNGYK